MLIGILNPRVRSCLAVLIVLTILTPGIAQESPPSAPPSASPAVFCPVCGTQNKPGSRYCQKDGAALPVLDPSRFARSFVRAPETFSTEEIQSAIHQAARSVVRIRVKASADLRYPNLNDDHRGYLAVVKDEETLFGSGFVIDANGTVVTNAHVAAPFGAPAQCTIEIADGEGFPAKVIGVDEASDLAVLKMEGCQLPALSWGDSESVQLGEEVWVLGNPLNIGLSMTRGTISSLVRARAGLNQVENFLHSDAFSTHGNSGGPLVSVQGLVLGVSDMGYSGFKAQGYSIPARMARWVVGKLRAQGSYARGFLGLQVRPVDAEGIRKFSLKRNNGMVVESVLSGTPAEVAGFRPGDVIFGVNGHAAPDSYLLQEAISSVGPGATLSIAVERGGQEAGISVTTALRPSRPRLDPLKDLERYLQAEFVEDPKKGQVILRIVNNFSIGLSYRFADGERVESVLAGQDWPEIPLDPETYRLAHPRPVKSLADLRGALQRMYLGGRVAVAMSLKSERTRVNSVALDENWAVIL